MLKKPTWSALNRFSSTDLVYYYGYLLGQLQYEGSGIWNRFNIMITLNGSLFGIVAFSYDKLAEKEKYLFILCFSLIGLFFSAWSLYVLKKLWIYHYHWKDQIAELELSLPKNWIRPVSRKVNADKPRKAANREIKAWLYCYTQPFFIILIVTWLILISTNKITIDLVNTIVQFCRSCQYQVYLYCCNVINCL